MAWTRRVITAHPACSCVVDFIVEETEALCKQCDIIDNSIPFQWEYMQRNNAAVTASYITNGISKLPLECFKDHKGVKSVTAIK